MWNLIIFKSDFVQFLRDILGIYYTDMTILLHTFLIYYKIITILSNQSFLLQNHSFIGLTVFLILYEIIAKLPSLCLDH